MLMEKLLERLPNMQQRKKRLNAKDESKLTPMHYAARYSHYHMIDFLIKNGASKENFYFLMVECPPPVSPLETTRKLQNFLLPAFQSPQVLVSYTYK